MPCSPKSNRLTSDRPETRGKDLISLYPKSTVDMIEPFNIWKFSGVGFHAAPSSHQAILNPSYHARQNPV